MHGGMDGGRDGGREMRINEKRKNHLGEKTRKGEKGEWGNTKERNKPTNVRMKDGSVNEDPQMERLQPNKDTATKKRK